MKESYSADSLTKSFNDNLILSNVYLKVCEGEIVALLGRNGSGKSTLLSILFGITKADNIHFRFNNKVLLDSKKFKNIFYYVPQYIFIPKNIKLKTLISISIDNKLFELFVDDDVIKEKLSSKISELSYGIQKYIQIKLCVYHNSKFCLLDEPYSGLSPLMCEKVNVFISQSSIKKGILITDHRYSELLKISDRILLLKNGRLGEINDQKELIYSGYLPK